MAGGDLIEAAPGTARVGWIGTGVMGASMCRHLVAAGFETTVTTRTRAKAEALLDDGATWADTPEDVAARSDIVFTMLGYTVVRQGGHGAGQHTKLVNQTLVAGNMVAVCEALLYAHRAGLDPETVLTSVSTGAAGSWSLANLAPRIVAGDFAPGFYVDHFVKDMSIALEEARRMRLALPGLALAQQLCGRV